MLRLKCNDGLKAYQFYGHQFIRGIFGAEIYQYRVLGVDLLGVATMDSEKSFAMELQVVDDLQKYVCATRDGIDAWLMYCSHLGGVCIQVVVIYGSSSRERRTRIFTIQCPISATLPAIYQAIDVNPIVNIMTKQILREMLNTSLAKAREKVIDFLVAISQAYSKVVDSFIFCYFVFPSLPCCKVFCLSASSLPFLAN